MEVPMTGNLLKTLRCIMQSTIAGHYMWYYRLLSSDTVYIKRKVGYTALLTEWLYEYMEW